MCMYACVHLFRHMYVYTHAHFCACIHTYMLICMCPYMCMLVLCAHTHMCIHVYTHAYMCISICMCTCVYTCLCVYMCMFCFRETCQVQSVCLQGHRGHFRSCQNLTVADLSNTRPNPAGIQRTCRSLPTCLLLLCSGDFSY